ncbi:MAG: glycosyltransferase [Acidobacteriaceae bacterium]
MPRVLLLRAELLPGSETFVAAQAVALRRYEAGFAGLKRVRDGLDVPGVVAVLDERGGWAGKAARLAYLRTGFTAGFERALREWRANVAHVHFAMDACAFLPVLRRLGVPFVVTLHGYDVGLSDAAHAGCAAGRMFLRRRAALWREAARFACVSEHLRRVAAERGFPEEKLRVHVTGVAVREFALRGGREPVALFVGRLVEKKGCRVLLEAWKAVEQELPEARLVVIGDGPLRGDLEGWARMHLRRFSFAGARTPAEVRGWMERAAVLAAPSVRAMDGDTEGLPTVVLEAMERGVAVVASDGTGAEEAVAAGETGFLTVQGDAEGLAKRLICLLRDEALAHGMGTRGRRRVEERFDIARQTEGLERIYDEVRGRDG